MSSGVWYSGSYSSQSLATGEENNSQMLSPTDGEESDALLQPADRPSRSTPSYSSINDTLPSESGSSSGLDSVVEQWRRCCGRGRQCRWYWCARLPKGRASLLVFFLNVVESFAFYGATSGALKLILGNRANTSFGFVITTFVEYCVTRSVYPIMGFLADVYIGRHRVIHASLWLFWLAYGLLAVAFSLNNGFGTSIVINRIIPVAAFVLLSLGAAGFEVNIIPYGMDQLQGASSVELSSYFYWYYFGRQLGTFFGVLLFVVLLAPHYAPQGSLEDIANTNSFNAVQPIVMLLLLSLAIVVFICFQDLVFKNRERENPLKLVVKVLWYAATVKRQLPQYRRAFRYGEGWKRRIELAKMNYDGIYTPEAVEDVKTFCRIILVLMTLGGYFTSYSANYVMMSYRVSLLLNNTSNVSYHVQAYLYPNVYTLFDTAVIMLAVMVANYLVVPYLPQSVNMKRRLGCGMMFNIAALVSAMLVSGLALHTQSKYQLCWLAIPALLSSLGEMSVFVTGLEFIYAQSPESMKGLLTGLFYCTFGLSSGVSTSIYYLFMPTEEQVEAITPEVKGINIVLWFYVTSAVIAMVGFVLYTVTACLYTNRQRSPVGGFDDDWDQSHIHSVFSVPS